MTDLSQGREPQFVLPTPAGSVHAVSGEVGPYHDVLRALLRSSVSPELSEDGLGEVMASADTGRALQLTTALLEQRLVECHSQPYRLGDNKVEEVLPTLLRKLSASGKGLLADNEGFLVSSVGYSEQHSIELAALASEVVDLNSRWKRHGRSADTLNGAGTSTSAAPAEPSWWTAGRPGSPGSLGFYVLTIGPYPFVLVLEGEATLTSPAFVWLVWSLSRRYDRGPAACV